MTIRTYDPEPKDDGDAARIAFYVEVRHEGQVGVPDLVLTDTIDSETARFGVLSTLVRWHCADPVSAEERQRHEAAALARGNRNASVDTPGLAGELYGFLCRYGPTGTTGRLGARGGWRGAG